MKKTAMPSSQATRLTSQRGWLARTRHEPIDFPRSLGMPLKCSVGTSINVQKAREKTATTPLVKNVTVVRARALKLKRNIKDPDRSDGICSIRDKYLQSARNRNSFEYYAYGGSKIIAPL